MSSSSLSYKSANLHDILSSQDSKDQDVSYFDVDQRKVTDETGVTISEEAFGSKLQCSDLWAALLFLVCLVAFIAIGILMIIFRVSSSNASNLSWNPPIGYFFYTLFGPVFMSIGLALVFTLLLCVFPACMIYASLILSMLICIGLAVFAFMSYDMIWLGVPSVIIAALYIPLFFLWRKRISSAAIMIGIAAKVTFKYGSTHLAMLAALFMEVILAAFWVVSITAVTTYSQVSKVQLILLYVFFGVSFYWCSQVIKTILHVTVSGFVASVYLLSDTSTSLERSVLRMAKNALSYSFGSVCFGSLVVPIVQTIRCSITTFAQTESNILGRCVDCILSIFEPITRLFNQYAFTQIAIFGKSYLRAAKDTWSMFKKTGFDVVVNTSIVTNVIVLIGVLIGFVSGIFAAFLLALGSLFSETYTYTPSPAYGVMATISGFTVGFTITIILLEVIESGVSTTLVIFAENPEAIKRTKPNFYTKFEATYGRYLLSR